MPKPDLKKIKSAPNSSRVPTKTIITVGLIASLSLFALLSPVLFYQPSKAELRVNGTILKLEIATTLASQAKGLSGRTALKPSSGMLFILAKPAAECFWMKDMKFPLDIIWLDQTKAVNYLQQGVRPSSYPGTFCPPVTAKYVIELNVGQANILQIHTGETLDF